MSVQLTRCLSFNMLAATVICIDTSSHAVYERKSYILISIHVILLLILFVNYYRIVKLDTNIIIYVIYENQC